MLILSEVSLLLHQLLDLLQQSIGLEQSKLVLKLVTEIGAFATHLLDFEWFLRGHWLEFAQERRWFRLTLQRWGNWWHFYCAQMLTAGREDLATHFLLHWWREGALSDSRRKEHFAWWLVCGISCLVEIDSRAWFSINRCFGALWISSKDLSCARDANYFVGFFTICLALAFNLHIKIGLHELWALV